MVKRFDNISCLTIESLVAILETYNAEMMQDEEKNASYNRSVGHALVSLINTSSASYVLPSSSYSPAQQYQQGPPATIQSSYSQQPMTPPAQQPASTFVVSEEHKNSVFCFCCQL